MSQILGVDTKPITALKQAHIPKHYLVLDTETQTEWKGSVRLEVFRLGWIFDMRASTDGSTTVVEQQYFNNEELFNQYIHDKSKQYKHLILISHNLFFDLQACGFFRYFFRWGWKLDFLYDRGLTYLLRVRKDTMSIDCVSSTNWYATSIKQLGAMVGLEKKEVSFVVADEATLKDYCYRDTEIVASILSYYIRWIVDNNIPRLKYTKSSQAVTAYRMRWLDKSLRRTVTPKVVELERAAYMGGRCEAYYIGKIRGEECVTYDVNSMYPYVMKHYKYPSRCRGYMINPDLKEVKTVLKDYGVIAEVDLLTDEPVYAVHHNDKLLFPVGEVHTYLTTESMKYAIKHGHLLKVYRMSVYEMSDLFSGYVDYWYARRKQYEWEGNQVMASLCKYMLNALYGKFGEKKVMREIYDDPSGEGYRREEVIDPVKHCVWVYTHLMGKLIVEHSEGDGDKSAVAVAAHVTDNARMTLWYLMASVGRSRVLYCDTDSIIIRRKDEKYLHWPISDTELGSVKREKVHHDLEIAGAKCYWSREVRKIKGVPARSVEIRPGVYTYQQFSRQATCLRNGIDRGVMIREVTKILRSSYDKGIVQKNGRVLPFTFPLSRSPS